MRNSSLLLLIGICICLTLVVVSFQQTLALRRIKRGSSATQNKTKLSNDILLDLHHISNDIKLGEQALNTSGGQPAIKENSEGTWAKKAVAAVEHAIDKAFASLNHKSDEEKNKKNAPTIPLPLHYTSNKVPTKQADNSVTVGKDLHKPSLAYMLENRLNAERFFGNMQHDGEFGAGDGPAEVVIIDNGMPQIMGMQHGLNSFAFHQPNLRNIANSFKRLAELSKESKLNNLNAMKINTDHSNNNANNNHNLFGKHDEDNGISKGNVNKEDTLFKHNTRNNNNNNSSSKISENGTDDNHKRNNEHITTSNNENNGNTKYNSNNKNNDALIDETSQHNSCMQQQLHEQQSEMKESFPALLSLAHKAMVGIGESAELQEHSQALQQQQQQQQRMKHYNEKTEDNGQQNTHAPIQSQAQAETRQQQLQFVKHTNGKMLPMESFLKFANMMLYKVGPDGTPIRAQGAQLAVNGNPTTSVISISPSMDGAEDAETIDYIYNSLDPQMNLLRNTASSVAAPLGQPLIGPANTALISRPFILPPYSLAGPTQPFNLIENALDMLLGTEDDGNDEMEIFCPIHHPKKKSSESAGEGKDKDGLIQVCSCRFFKKNKNA